jgi:hypothetical protein
MRSLLVLLAVAWLAASIGACGGAGANTRSAARRSPGPTSSTPAGAATTSSTADHTTNYTKVDRDGDSDVGAYADDTNNNAVFAFGHAAGARDRGAITALVERFYAAALAGDSAAGCSMLYSTVAEGAAEDYGLAQGPIYLRGAKTCKEIMAKLFSHFHALLALEVPKLRVTHVIVKEGHAIALLGFAAMPEREIQLYREGHLWRMDELIDRELP